MATKMVNGVPGISTSLPLELPRIQAAALPFYSRSRIAHISFTNKGLELRGIRGFKPEVYKKLISLLHIHAKIPDTIPMFKKLDQQIGGFNGDEKADESLCINGILIQIVFKVYIAFT